MSPTSATVAPGASQQFTAVGWIDGSSVTPPGQSWTATGGSVSSTGLYTAGSTPGTYQITVVSAPTYHQESATITISGTAQPAATVSSVVVSPSGRTTVYKGATQQFTATAQLSNGSTQNNAAVTWSATGGTISSSGAYKAGNTSGYFRVIGRSSNGKADTSDVTVPTTSATINSIIVTPATASVAASAAQQFSASAKLMDGSTLSTPSVTWSATGGSVNTSGRFTAGTTAGNYRVIARSSNGKADTSAVTVTAGAAATVTSISLTPATATLAVGASQTFATQVTYSDGSTQTNPTLTWSASGGTMGSGQVYTAGTIAGTYRVIATASNGKADTSTVVLNTVSSPPPSNGNPMYFNSAEAGCGSDGNVLLCDDFEDGDWYAKDCDQANSSGGLLQTDGWCGNIYDNPITPAKAAVCGNQGYRSNCAATQGATNGEAGGRNMADHSLSTPVKDVYVRFYTKPTAGYKFGAEKVLSVNKDGAGAGGIYWGNLHINCGGSGGGSTGQLQWQPVAPAPDGCKNIIQMVPDHWYYIELHMNVAAGVLQVYADDCGTGQGTGCTGTPTLRLDLSGWKYPSTSNNVASLWFENWASPGSVGTRLLDQIKVSRVGPIGFAR